jgi:hypothetical protein
MTFSEFKSSLSQNHPPENFSDLLKALWYDGKNDWETAHNFAQKKETSDYSLIHAYLHRKEGDNWNAGYWYKKARREMPGYSLEEEWESLVKEFLA